ncbi:MAG: RNA-binding S4 domain-containing protein [Pseudomonadota bacterium]
MQELAFALDAEYVELNQLLKLVGLCESGGAGKVLVAEGRVQVDGVIETRKTAKIRAGQVVACGDVRVTVGAG